MNYTTHYTSPLGDILLAADEQGLTGLWFDNQKYYAAHLSSNHKECNHPILKEAQKWLDIYFTGQEPDFIPLIHLAGTEFQIAVWNILQQIPYGETTTYGEIAKKIALQRGLARMSSQAVGGAVGHNPISILIPCHRVIGSNHSLTGYAGGVHKKRALLQLEGIDITKFITLPKELPLC
ncbi:MAG: methylated-DNA--[protein]-cysteine S-methyltransferase [Lachnospiraceae bacterium]|nr:methylated-DNA--[protein]-cysteine S-methyltransferase [Lachnospiraceae bacterium]MDD3615071.1 methylated-DNA--[protein]-cysteine S-methyltransferase [Lachnospiraceae bacterium]